MNTNLDIRSYVNPHPRFGISGQMERLSDGELYVEDKTGKVINAVISSVRRDRRSIVQVDELFLLAPVTGKPRQRRKILAERVEAVKERGGIVRERSSGLQSDQAGFAKAIVRATEMIASSGRGKASDGKQGRPGRQFTKEQRDAMERIWSSRKYATRDEATLAIQALGIHITRPRLYQLLGKPDQGKEPIDEKAVKASRRRKRRCYVYFIKSGNVVKIGKSENPRKRMAALAGANHTKLEMLALVDGDLARERTLHKKFKAHHIKGEWFHLDAAILRYLKSVKKSAHKG